MVIPQPREVNASFVVDTYSAAARALIGHGTSGSTRLLGVSKTFRLFAHFNKYENKKDQQSRYVFYKN